ncbi:MAG: hypothetical protein IRZ09_03210 [Variibacter sp.]|nr:hypothetical protein [Variibacter sp.]
MQTTSDKVLIGRIASGDRLAMQVLFARHHVRAYRFVLRLVNDPALAEDLISEVFLDVWRQAGRFEARSAVSTWLLAIARFKVLSAPRRRRDQTLNAETAAAFEDFSDTPEVALQKKDKGEILRERLVETIYLNETPGAPSARAWEKLMAAIEAESGPAPTKARLSLAAWLGERLAAFPACKLAYAATSARSSSSRRPACSRASFCPSGCARTARRRAGSIPTGRRRRDRGRLSSAGCSRAHPRRPSLARARNERARSFPTTAHDESA